MAITLFAVATVPATDGGTATTGSDTPLAITPPADMVAGQLVVIDAAVRRNDAQSMAISEAGGQTWNTLDAFPTTQVGSATIRRFWCRFNGTWSANPSVYPDNQSSEADMALIMSVFAPNTANATWTLDASPVWSSDTGNASSPYEVTLSGVTTQANGALAVAFSAWTDNVNCTVHNANGYSTAVVGHDETFGTGLCVSTLYKIQASAGASGSYELAATAGGYNDACLAVTCSFLEGAPGVSYCLKLLADPSAAGAEAVEGVVLNAARDTVIGEFTGQAFEDDLESGEAVLLIPVEDIIPDGSALTTSDEPIVFAYNSTDGTVGEGSATVIEV